jgi:PAS domain S-box-containing protein
MNSIVDKITRLMTLRFEDKELEKSFRTDHFEKSLVRIRFTILLAAFLYALFGVLDEAIIPEVRHEAWIIRYLVFCPLALVVYALSHLRSFHKLLEFSIFALGFVAGAGIVVMIALASPPGSDLYYAGLLLTCWFYYTFIRLRFLPATILSWTIFLLYEVTAIWIKGTSSPILINNSFFFVAFNITGMWACYSMERYARQDFLQRKTILEQAEKLRMIFDKSPVGILHFDNQGAITECNTSFALLIGSSRESLIGLNMITDLQDDRVISAVKQALDGHMGHCEGDYVSVSAKKSVTATGNFAPILNSEGTVVGGIGIIEDFTDRQRALAALHESEEKYRTVLESSPDPIVVYDRAGLVTYINPAFVKTFGWNQQELLGKQIDYVPEAELPEAMRTLTFLFEGEKVPSFETRRLTKDGTVLDVQISAALMRNAIGEPIGNVVTLLDVTQRKVVEKALMASEEGNRLLIEGSPVGIGIVQDGEYAYVNPALVMMMGCKSPEEIVGQSPLEFIVSEDRDSVMEKVGKILVGADNTANYKVRGIKKSGESFVVSVWPRRTDYLGKPALLAFVLDVTEENRLKAQLVHAQKMEAIGTLAGGVAHDFNNLLQVVLGYSGLLLAKTPPSSRQHDNLQKINSAARRGANLVKELLTFSRKTATSPCPLDLNHQVTEVGSLLERTIPKMIKIELRLGEDLSIIQADPNQLEQIILNLVVNARDAMPDGGMVTLETQNVVLDHEYCKAHLGAKPGTYVMLSVSDTGHGMNKEVLEHIFEPFYTTKDVGKGTGLGLSMVYGIVKQHDGYISCESQPGHGTTFRIYFPAVEKEEEEEVHEQVDVSSLPGGFETLLMVDDEELVRDLGSDYLRQAGYTVLTASNGREALEVYQENQDDVCLVLLDLIMPEMGGRKCFKELLKINPKVKVLIVSGYTSDASEKDVFELGAGGFVKKPYDPTKLLQTIRDVLG